MKVLKNHAQQLATGLDCTTNNIQEEAHKSFVKECHFLKCLRHANVVRHFHTHIDSKSKLPMLTMELMNCSLKAYLQKRRGNKLDLKCQMSLCLDVAKGLNYLHSKKIIHRDLCDDNVLLALSAASPTAKIADFGMSRIYNQDYMSSTLSALGHREVYFPKEAREDPCHYSYAIDVYSFGVIAIQIVQVIVGLKKKEDLKPLVKKISKSHKLKLIILNCLSEDAKTRHTAAQLVNYIANVKHQSYDAISGVYHSKINCC